MTFNGDDIAALRMAARPLTLSHGPRGVLVEGPSASAVRAFTGLFPNSLGAASLARHNGRAWTARLPQNALAATPFLRWRGAPRLVLSHRDLRVLSRWMQRLESRYGRASFIAPRKAPRNGKWYFVLPLPWAAGVARDFAEPLARTAVTMRASSNRLGQFGEGIGEEEVEEETDDGFGDFLEACPPGEHFDVLAFTCVPDDVDEAGPPNVHECPPGQFWDPFTEQCLCADPGAMLGPNGTCIPLACPPGAHLEAGVCVDDVKPGPGGGTTTTVPPGGDTTTTDTPPPAGDEDDDLGVWMVTGLVVTAVAVGLGAWLGLGKKKRKRAA